MQVICKKHKTPMEHTGYERGYRIWTCKKCKKKKIKVKSASSKALQTIILMSVIVLYTLFLVGNVSAAFPTQDTKFYWNLDEGTGTTAADMINLNTLTFNTGENWTSNGILSNAFQGDGLRYMTSGSNVGITAKQARTFNFWINTKTTAVEGGGQDKIFFWYGNWAANQALGLYFQAGTNQLYYNDLATDSFTGITKAGVWQMLTLQYNGTDVILYENGIFKYNNPLPSLNTQDSVLYLSTRPPAGGAGIADFNIDEVGVWNRTLTSTEITTLYNGGVGLTYPKPPITINSYVYNSTTYETLSETYLVTATYDNSTYSNISANIIYNGTSYPTTRLDAANTTTFSFTRVIPLTANIETKNFYWNFTLTNSTGGLSYQDSAIQTQTINPVILSLCNSTINVPYINYTFKDEETNGDVYAALTATIPYTLNNGGITKTLSYVNSGMNLSYAFCLTPGNLTLYATPSLQYFNTTYTTRTYNYLSVQTYTSSTTNKVLYLLKTTSGLYVSFQVLTIIQQPIDNVLITLTNGGNVVETKSTDNAGIATFFLNPNVLYNLTAVKTLFNTYSTSIVPTQTSYTITMSGSGTGNITSYNQGISITTLPNPPYLLNDTTYNFNATLISSYLNLNSWGFNITNGTDLLASNNSGVGGIGNLGTLINNVNVGSSKNIIFNVFWNYQGVNTSQTVYYTVEQLTGTSWSIKNLNDDVKSYVSSGFFGLTPIGLNIIIFVIIFMIAGVTSWRFGLYSPTIIVGLIWGLVIFFDVILGLIYYPPFMKVPYVASSIIGIVFIALAIREGTKY